jgi:hypothetical protein
MVMKSLNIIAALLAANLIFSGCKDDDKPAPGRIEQNLSLSFDMLLDGTPAAINANLESNSPELKGIRVDRMMVYFSDIEIQREDDSWVPVVDVLYYNLQSARHKKFDFKVPVGNYKSIRFAVGLNAAQNGSDPLQFDNSHPLSSANGMYWTWATKYRFVIFEGRVSQTGPITGTDNIIFMYHPGHDDLHEIKSYPVAFATNEENQKELTIGVSINQIFSGAGGTFNLPDERITHTTPEDFHIAEMVMENFRHGITILQK